MMGAHPVWWLLTAASIVWYTGVTIYVALRGTVDIRHMLARLASRDEVPPP